MDRDEMRRRLKEVKVASVKMVFTTKHLGTDGLPKDFVRKWKNVTAAEVRYFVWPKVVLDGPGGKKAFSFTWMNPGAVQEPVKKGTVSELEKALATAALGKAQRIPGELRGLSVRMAEVLRREIEYKAIRMCRSAALRSKAQDVWLKERRVDAYMELHRFLDARFNELTDYSVREAWKDVKKLRTVRKVMEA